jgi:hypothetical protein
MTKEFRGDDEAGAPDSKGAVEDDVQRINVIKGDEALGYDGAGREEHSGEDASSNESGLADNANVPDHQRRE